MARKGQVEFAIIIGLIIIAVLAILFSLSSLAPPSVGPSSFSGEQKSVELYVKDAVSRSSESVITKIYTTGGYYELEDELATEFAGNEIAYWQACSDLSIPDIEGNFINGLEKEIKKQIPEKTDIAGNQIGFMLEEVVVKARFFDNEIKLEVYLPTTVNGALMPQPYTLTFPTKLHRIYDFAQNFTKFQEKYRALDKNLIKLMGRSNPNDDIEGSCWLPTSGVYEGSTLRRSYSALKTCMEKMVEYTLSNTFEWIQPIMQGDVLPVEMLDHAFIFQIEEDDGWGQYADLDPDFYIGGQGSSFTKGNPRMTFRTIPDPVKIKAGIQLFIIPQMVEYSVNYDVSFPVVITVWDDIMRRTFMFVNFVNIRESIASNECESVATPDPTAILCNQEADIETDITVKDFSEENEPIPDVWINYGVCELGKTDGTGNLKRDVSELPGGDETKLTLSRDGGEHYDEYTICTNAIDMPGEILFPLNKKFTIKVHIVEIDEHAVPLSLPPIIEYTIGDIRDVVNKMVPMKDIDKIEMDRVGMKLTRKARNEDECMDPEEYPYINYEIISIGSVMYYRIADYTRPVCTEEGCLIRSLTELALPATALYDFEMGLEARMIISAEAEVDYKTETLHIYLPNAEESQAGIVNAIFSECNIKPVSKVELNKDQLLGCGVEV